MTAQQKIITALFWIILSLLAYIVVMQPKVKASEEIIQAQNRIQELSWMIANLWKEWRIAEDAKAECIDSWNKQQQEANKSADKLRAEKEELEGFLLRSQPQTKINNNLQEQEYTTNDIDGMTTDNKWYRKLLKWVGLI